MKSTPNLTLIQKVCVGLDSVQWSMVSVQWSLVIGQWSVVASRSSDIQYQIMHRNGRKIPYRARNWSVDVFVSVINDFHDNNVFWIFREKISSKTENFTLFLQNFDIRIKLFQKIRKNYFLSKIIQSDEKHIY